MSNEKVAATGLRCNCDYSRNLIDVHEDLCQRVTVEFEPGDPGMDDVLMAQAANRKRTTPDLTPEQDLRAAITERLTGAIHFSGCPGGTDTCRCLIGRLNWAINAEEVTS